MDADKNEIFFNKLDEHHQIWLVEDKVNQKIIGTGTILIEHKLIRNYAKVAHLEDIVILPAYQNQKIGTMLVDHLIKIAQELKCYKCILHCNPMLVKFYEKNNFSNYGSHMRLDLELNEI